jgi:hypothetical protein
MLYVPGSMYLGSVPSLFVVNADVNDDPPVTADQCVAADPSRFSRVTEADGRALPAVSVTHPHA